MSLRTLPDRPSVVTRRRLPLSAGLTLLGIALVATCLLSVGTGPVTVPVDETVAILWAHLTPGEHLATWSATNEQIVWSFRLPRVLLAAAVGAALGTVGVLLQAVVRNPLADPYVLGASSDAPSLPSTSSPTARAPRRPGAPRTPPRRRGRRPARTRSPG